MDKTATSGGRTLHYLRQAARLSLLDLAAVLQLELGESIDAGHINKIETGAIRKPQAQTLEAILSGLKAGYRDQRDVLEAFGYKVPRTLPNEQEIAEACILCAPELNDATCPIYLMDDGQRLLAWNRYVPRLIGKHPDDPALAQFAGVTLIDLAFNPAYRTTFLIDNPDEYLPMWLHFIKTGLRFYDEEPWYTALITESRRLPGFSAMWEKVEGTAVQRVATQNIIPIKLDVPDVGLLQFRLVSQPFVLDPRFQIIHYVPFGAATLRQCALWAEEEGIV